MTFVVGVANVFVECAAQIAKEINYEQIRTGKKSVELTLCNQDIENLLSFTRTVANNNQQRSLTLLAIFLL